MGCNSFLIHSQRVAKLNRPTHSLFAMITKFKKCWTHIINTVMRLTVKIISFHILLLHDSHLAPFKKLVLVHNT